MPRLRAEQIQQLTLTNAQIAANAAIEQNKIEDWTENAEGWISKGVIKTIDNATIPTWDGSQKGQLYYNTDTSELFIGLVSDPFYQLVAGAGVGDGGLDEVVIVQMATEATDWAAGDPGYGTGRTFSLGVDIAADGSNADVFLNGVLQELGSTGDYIVSAPQEIKFNQNLISEEDKVTVIANQASNLVNYATKAYVDNKLLGENSHVHNGVDSEKIDINNLANMTSLNNNIAPSLDDSVSLGDATHRFAEIHAVDAFFSNSTIYIGGIALREQSGRLKVSSVDRTGPSPVVTETFDVPVSGNSNQPSEIAAGAGQPIVLDSDTGITIKGNILPEMTGAVGSVSDRDIGSETQKFRAVYADEIFVGASSLYVNGKKVIEDVSDNMTFKTDPDQAMSIVTQSSVPGSGNGNLSFSSQNEINMMASGGIEATVSGVSTKHMNFSNESDGGNITFSATGENSDVQLSAAGQVVLDAPTTVISGNLTINGTTTTLNSTNTNVQDSTFTIKTAETPFDGNASFEVQRASGNAKLQWNETGKRWEAHEGSDGNEIWDITNPTRIDGVNFYTGSDAPTETTRLNMQGYFYATRVYNAVYNDLAEFFEKSEEAEAGMVLVQTESGVAPSKKRADGAVVGVYSDTYGYALGADDTENKLPVGLTGRVDVWVEEPVSIGDLLVSSDRVGFAAVATEKEKARAGIIIGKALKVSNDASPKRISMLIMNR